ncbi:asparagine synthase (glutamine-hydrolyzing) [Selenomonadales bacterium OttesenSCG-928-I06]|nr:asparagine synthase (glutamine-hydrolyzing) [Selenomonadales bacterium OttesenSCG-928-I06]
MCGIAGWINLDGNLKDKTIVLDNMTKTLSDRGPDNEGKYVSEKALLGHRRLIVIDPEGGAQPMTRYQGDNKFVIVYNGQIYNAQDLREELQKKDYVFTTTSDTEVLLYSYIEWRESCLEKFNGIFAFAIWDDKKESLFLARDRIGVKPLFYTKRPQGLIFGSELKTLLANPHVESKIDKEALAEILMMGPARTPGYGIFQNVNELKPGHFLIYNKDNQTIRQYWSLKSEPHTDDFQTTCEKVRWILTDAVKRQLISDVPLCTLLSGGLDSSVLTALIVNHYKENNLGTLDTFSVNYVDNEKHFRENSFQPNSDAPWVKIVAEYLKTNHHNVLLDTPELASTLPNACFARDLPGMADTDTSLYLFCGEIKKQATVALSGECADEVFGGYPWFQREEMINSTTFPWALRPKIRLNWLSQEVQEQINPLEHVQRRYNEALAEVPYLLGENAKAARMREISYLSLTRFMPTLLDRNDRMSMAQGLEVRVPFCDHRLVEYVWNIPWSMKYYQDREKGLLRAALSDVLPHDVIWRKKSPYPKTHNPSYTERVVKEALAILEDKTSPILPLVNVTYLKEFAKTDLSTTSVPWFGQLMGAPQLFAYLIQLNYWFKTYKVEII